MKVVGRGHQTVGRTGRGDRSARVAEHHVRVARRIRANPAVHGMHAPVLFGGRRVVRNDAAGDDRNARLERHRVQGFELALHSGRVAALINVVHAGDDDQQIGVEIGEARPDLIGPLAVDAAVHHPPIGMRFHQPVRVLALDVSGSVRRRFERRLETRRPRRR